MYDALNHSFRRLDGCQRLVIEAPLKTEAAVRQMAQSRSSLEKCVVEFMLSGGFKSPKLYGDEYEDRPIWHMDEPLEICSLELREKVVRWLRDFDQNAARHEVTLSRSHRYIEEVCRASRQDTAQGKEERIGMPSSVAHHPPSAVAP